MTQAIFQGLLFKSFQNGFHRAPRLQNRRQNEPQFDQNDKIWGSKSVEIQKNCPANKKNVNMTPKSEKIKPTPPLSPRPSSSFLAPPPHSSVRGPRYSEKEGRRESRSEDMGSGGQRGVVASLLWFECSRAVRASPTESHAEEEWEGLGSSFDGLDG